MMKPIKLAIAPLQLVAGLKTDDQLFEIISACVDVRNDPDLLRRVISYCQGTLMFSYDAPDGEEPVDRKN
jgi:hypothetical protein